MKIVFHEKYFDVYSSDPASAKGRLDDPYRILKEARTTIPFTIQDGFHELPILGIPIESLILGLALALGILFYRRKVRGKIGRTPPST